MIKLYKNFLPLSFFLLLFIFYFLYSFPVSAASLYLEPSAGQYGAGQIFNQDIRVDNQGQSLNAFEIYLKYPADLINVINVSLANSILGPILESPKIDQVKGLIYFSGIIPGGYNGRITGDPGNSNLLANLTFQIKTDDNLKYPQYAEIKLSKDSLVLLNDGLGTKTNLTTNDARIEIVKKTFNQEDLLLNNNQEDKSLPQILTAEIIRHPSIFNNQYFLIFSAEDKESGVKKFQIAERLNNKDNLNWLEVSSPYLIKDQSLKSNIYLKVIDGAGNETIKIINAEENKMTVYNKYLYPVIILMALLMAGFLAYKLLVKRKNKSFNS